MIIWTRWGILALLFAPIALIIGLVILRPIMYGANAATTNAQDGILVGVGLLVSATLCWITMELMVGRVIDKPKPVYVMRELAQPRQQPDGTWATHDWIQPTDPATGQPAVQRRQSTLFFIPLKAWPFIYAGLAVIVLVISFIQLGQQ